MGRRSVEPGHSNSTLLWTGPEYMYSMLKYNKVELPEEAFVILRLFPLKKSERLQCSSDLAENVTYDSLCIVQDFCRVREDAIQQTFSTIYMSEIDCNMLWSSHFARILEKYGADKELEW